MYTTSKYKKVYIGNRKEKYIAPKVIEFNKVRPYYKKVKFDQSKEERKIKLSIIITISLGIIFVYLGLVFLGTKDELDDIVKVDTDIEQNVTSIEDAEKLLGFKTININNLPIEFEQNYMAVDQANNIYKTHFTVKGGRKSQDKTILLVQKKSGLTSIVGTIDGKNAEYRAFNEENKDLTTYINSFENKSIINIVQWNDGKYEFIVAGDLGIEGLSKFISDVLDMEISFNIRNNK